jgi:bacterial/archaeal transporter family protein
MWVLLAASSAIFLGFYEVSKKLAVTKNAVLPVLMLSTLASSIIFILPWFGSITSMIPEGNFFYVPSATLYQHFLILIKTVIVLISWIFTYFAVKHLPITIVSPIRSTGPLWTLLGAIVIFRESLTGMQWLGVIVTLAFFFSTSFSGKNEGIFIRNNKWMWFIIIGTLAGSVSGLYDKFLLKQVHRMTVQCYFSFYQFIIMAPIVWFLWYPKRKATTKFEWRWSIPLIGVTLIIADFVYFYALSDPDSLISIVSALRRGSVVIAFLTGAFILKEKRIKEKAIYLLGILTGIALIIFGSA